VTVIAYRDGVMAADTLMVDGNNNRIAQATKIIRNANGDLCGVAGDAGPCYAFLQWFQGLGEAERPEFKPGSGVRALIVRVSNSHPAWIVDESGEFVIRDRFYAIGCGRPEAMAAMWMGADAVKAVECAIALDTGCGGSIEVLTHEKSVLRRLTDFGEPVECRLA